MRFAARLRGRGTVSVLAAALLALTSTVPASAQSWPTKPVRIIVPFAPGSATDLVPRAVFDQVQNQLGQSFIIDNRPGGGTTTGTAAVAKADPDGYTILVHSNGFVTTPAIQPNVPYDPVRDFAAITPLANVPMVLVISPEKKIKTLRQLVDYAKANPGKLNYAAAGIGTPPHLTMERFRVAAGFTGQIVPFKGAAEAVTEVLAGRVDVYFCPLPPAISLIEAGKLLPLAVSSATRAAALPDVPTTLEQGYANSDFSFWIGMFVPKQTPRGVVARMHEVTVKGLNTEAAKSRFVKLGVEPMIMTPEAFDARVARETKIAVELAKAVGL
ncbi:MAG: tripartite tricarboxylate transporter substrate binding protein [Hyphomicrobiales bacterium]|nr:tripartite tricarboxylate transporter substrate binding protein [Hyphomicrobiales bacterium]